MIIARQEANRDAIVDIGGWLRSLGLEEYETAPPAKPFRDTVLPSLTAEDLKDLNIGSIDHRWKLLDAIDLVGIDAKAKAALAILPEFDKALGRKKDGPAHPDHLDEAACRIP